MPDDLTNRGAADAQRINMNERHEVEYWTKKYGVTAERLKKAVEEAGPMAKDVEKKLKG